MKHIIFLFIISTNLIMAQNMENKFTGAVPDSIPPVLFQSLQDFDITEITDLPLIKVYSLEETALADFKNYDTLIRSKYKVYGFSQNENISTETGLISWIQGLFDNMIDESVAPVEIPIADIEGCSLIQHREKGRIDVLVETKKISYWYIYHIEE